MQKLVLVARILLGLIFVVFSTNYFFGFFEMPPMSPEGGQFIGAIIGTGYLFTFMKIVELLAGILLLAGKLVPLALTVLAPIILNIFLFHIFLDPGGLIMGLLLLALELFLAYSYRGSFAAILNPSAQPS